jgi:hypothetical protein
MELENRPSLFKTKLEALAYLLGFLVMSFLVGVLMFTIVYSIGHTLTKMLRMIGQ